MYVYTWRPSMASCGGPLGKPFHDYTRQLPSVWNFNMGCVHQRLGITSAATALGIKLCLPWARALNIWYNPAHNPADTCLLCLWLSAASTHMQRSAQQCRCMAAV